MTQTKIIPCSAHLITADASDNVTDFLGLFWPHLPKPGLLVISTNLVQTVSSTSSFVSSSPFFQFPSSSSLSCLFYLFSHSHYLPHRQLDLFLLFHHSPLHVIFYCCVESSSSRQLSFFSCLTYLCSSEFRRPRAANCHIFWACSE